MTQFKVGDWVRYNNQIIQITELEYLECSNYHGQLFKFKYQDFKGWAYASDAYLWQPKPDEYIWDSLYKSIGKVTYNDGITISYKDLLDSYTTEFNTTNLVRCEPFIGELPSFLKI